MNLVVSGSIYSLMPEMFQNSKESLFGRADNFIKLSAFDLATLKEIMRDYTQYVDDDLVVLYSFTGGPNIWNFFCDNTILEVDEMIDFMFRKKFSFIDEGKNLLIEVFYKKSCSLLFGIEYHFGGG